MIELPDAGIANDLIIVASQRAGAEVVGSLPAGIEAQIQVVNAGDRVRAARLKKLADPVDADGFKFIGDKLTRDAEVVGSVPAAEVPNEQSPPNHVGDERVDAAGVIERSRAPAADDRGEIGVQRAATKVIDARGPGPDCEVQIVAHAGSDRARRLREHAVPGSRARSVVPTDENPCRGQGVVRRERERVRQCSRGGQIDAEQPQCRRTRVEGHRVGRGVGIVNPHRLVQNRDAADVGAAGACGAPVVTGAPITAGDTVLPELGGMAGCDMAQDKHHHQKYLRNCSECRLLILEHS